MEETERIEMKDTRQDWMERGKKGKLHIPASKSFTSGDVKGF